MSDERGWLMGMGLVKDGIQKKAFTSDDAFGLVVLHGPLRRSHRDGGHAAGDCGRGSGLCCEARTLGYTLLIDLFKCDTFSKGLGGLLGLLPL